MESWNEEKTYDEQIAPLMQQIIAICQAHNIPMVASFAFMRDTSIPDTGLCTTSIPVPGREVPQIAMATHVLLMGTSIEDGAQHIRQADRDIFVGTVAQKGGYKP